MLVSSIDTERAFSIGRRQLNFMQTNMSSQSFRAKMAIGSWEKTPLFPGVDAIAGMLQQKMSGGDESEVFVTR